MRRAAKDSKQPASQGGEILGRARKAAESAPKAATRVRCAATKKDGSPCAGLATVGKHCPLHSPRWSEAEKQIWRKRGNLALQQQRRGDFTKADFSSADGARAALEEAADLVRAGKMTVSVANAVSKLAGVALKVSEVALGKRLGEIEREIKDRAKTRR
jgi:hypothetical protein